MVRRAALHVLLSAPGGRAADADARYAVESVIAEATVRDLIPQLLRAGAVGSSSTP